MTKRGLLNKLIKEFVAKFGYNTEVRINEIWLEHVYDVGTPMIKKIKVNDSTSEVPGLNFYVDFYSWGWTDDTHNCWYKDRKKYVEEYGIKALADALGVKIITRTDYAISTLQKIKK